MMLIGRIVKTIFIIVAVICMLFTALVVGINVKYYNNVEQQVDGVVDAVMEVSAVDWIPSKETTDKDVTEDDVIITQDDNGRDVIIDEELLVDKVQEIF